MTNHTKRLALLALAGVPLLAGAACEPEAAIDRTLLGGFVTISPATYTEDPDLRESARDTWDTAQDLGETLPRWNRVQGDMRRFGAWKYALTYRGDVDFYAFTAGADGDFQAVLHYGGVVPPGPGPGPTDTGDTGDTGDSGDTGDTG